MRPQSQHTDDRILEFLSYISSKKLDGQRLTRDSKTGCVKFTPCTFVPFDDVKTYFHDREKISLLLKSVYGHDKGAHDAETIFSIGLKAFCTLLCIGRGSLIRYFISNDIGDSRLPIRTLPDDLKHINDSDDTFWTEFNQQQWCFLPYTFDLVNINIKVPDLAIFPIIKVKELDTRDGRTVHKIRIHEGYHNLRPKAAGLSTQQEEDRNTFVLKSLDGKNSKNLEQYENEVDALRRLGCNGLPGNRRNPPAEIIRCFGSFKHNDMFHILLECADRGTLRDYLSKTPRPRSYNDLVDFYENFRALAIGVSRIHHVLSESNEVSIGVFQGYHQDLHLSNILVFTDDVGSPYKVKFKIADLGLTNFVENPYYLLKASGQGKPGTRTCGSPESHQARYYSNGEFTSGQPDDIWSLACIFSIAATWAVGGWGYVEQYANYRREARRALDLSNSDCFHDDYKVLRVIREWHEGLVDRKAGYDTITPRLWEELLEPAFADAARRSPAFTFRVDTNILKRGTSDTPKKSFTIDMGCVNSQKTDFTSLPRPSRMGITGLPESVPSRRQERSTKRSSVELHDVSDEDLSRPWTNAEELTTVSPTSLKDNHQSVQAESSRRPADRYSVDEHHYSRTYRDSHSKATIRNSQALSLTEANRASNIHREESSSKGLSEISHLNTEDGLQPPSSRTSYNPELSDSSKGKEKVNTIYHDKGCPANPKNKPEVDHMSVEQLFAWKEARDRRKMLDSRDSFDERVPSSKLKEYLQGRDHIFLFEDSGSMQPHWREVCKLFGAIAKFIKECDKDGLEVYFTVSQKHLKSKDSKPLVDLVLSMGNHLNSSSQPIETLRKIWDTHKNGIRDGKRARLLGPRQKVGLTIYIFTDGKWQGGTNMEGFLSDVVAFLQEHKCAQRQVGIQFIQFGNGVVETDRLERFDKELKKILSRDIVDREPSNGNVWKMLLGSVLPGFDDDDDEDKCNCQGVTSQT